MNERTDTTFHESGDFAHTLTTQPIAAPPGRVHVAIFSRWGRAKNPAGVQRLLGLTLSRSELGLLIQGLQTAAASLQEEQQEHDA